MLPVSVGPSAGPAKNDDIGLEFANDADDFAEYPVMIPLVEGFLGRFRIAEIDCAREVLFRAIDAALQIYARALNDGVEKYLVGRPSQVVQRRFNTVMAAE